MVGVVVHAVGVPCLLVIVDVCDEKTVAGNTLVPSCTLAVVHEVELVLVLLVIDNVCLAVVCERLHIAYDGVGLELHGSCPSCHPSFVSGEVGGAESVAVVASLMEEVPRVHTVAAAVCGVVEVRIAEAV